MIMKCFEIVVFGAGWLAKMGGEGPKNTCLKKKFSSPTLTVDELDALANQFISAATDGTYKEKGWPSSTYAVSKV